MLAEREVALLAVGALHAREQRSARDGVAHLEALNALADLDHVARELMTEHDGIKMRPVMQDARHVAAADTRCPHMYLYRSGKGFRGRKLLIAKILVAMQNCCFHH